MKTQDTPITEETAQALKANGFTEIRSTLKREGDYFCWRDQDGKLRSPLFTTLEQAYYLHNQYPMLTAEEWPEYHPITEEAAGCIMRSLGYAK